MLRSRWEMRSRMGSTLSTHRWERPLNTSSCKSIPAAAISGCLVPGLVTRQRLPAWVIHVSLSFARNPETRRLCPAEGWNPSSHCHPPVDPSKSSSLTILDQGGFSISYVTPGSGVVGDYISDDFGIGGITLKNITMAVATKANYVPTGIMGIGFDSGESITSTSGQPYPNVIDEMVQQGLINSRSYSLWLNDLRKPLDKGIFPCPG
jgi:hypothetical protein